MRAWHEPEHLPGQEFGKPVEKIARVLSPGGELRVKVPHGLKGRFDPFHLRDFDRNTHDGFTISKFNVTTQVPGPPGGS